MHKFQVHNAVGADGFTFIGHKQIFLTTFKEDGFILMPYHRPYDPIEYDFNGKFVRKWTEVEYDASIPKGHYRHNLHEPHKKVVEVATKVIWDNRSRHSQEGPPKDLITTTTYDNQSEFQETINSIGDVNEVEEWICGDIKLVRWSGKKSLFIISHIADNRIISAVCFDEYNFTDGDCGTSVYVVNEKHILMYNDGDCPSVLLMQNRSKNTKLSPISRGTMTDAESVEHHFNGLRQSIINLLYRFYDEELYGVYLESGGKYCVKKRASGKLFLTVVQSNSELKMTKSDGESIIINMTNITNADVIRIRQLTED